MIISTARRLLAIGGIFTLTGCGALGTLGTAAEVLGTVLGQPAGAAQQGQVTAEVQAVDTRQQAIEVATQDGQRGAVRYDQRTIVVYQGQQYPVTALERGDIVVMQLVEEQGVLYTPRIDVQQSAQQRGGTGTGAIQQFTGRVGQIDQNAGVFVLQTASGNLTVALPYNAPQATVDYFRRLRTGDTVRLEARPVAAGRVEIHRFL